MSKVRFYCDVPEYFDPNFSLAAWQKPFHRPTEGWRRIAFDVQMPPDVWKPFDISAQAENVHFTIVDEEGPAA